MNKLVMSQRDQKYNAFTTQRVEDMFEIRKKICLLGEAGVGKTSLINRYVKNSFDDKYISTLGTKVSKKKIYLPITDETGKSVETPVTLAIWDVIGQQEFHSLVLKYFKDSDGGLLVVDGSRPETIEHTRRWITSFIGVVGNVPILILINKLDLIKTDTFDFKPFKEFLSEFGTSYIFTSAKYGANVITGFNNIVESMVRARHDYKNITNLAGVADAIIVDFCAILGGFEKGMSIVSHQFKKAGVNTLNPTKEQLLVALQNLVGISQDIQGIEVAKRENNKFQQILNRF